MAWVDLSITEVQNMIEEYYGTGSYASDTVEDETSFGINASAGVDSAYSRGDHTHGTPDNPVPAHESTYNHALLHSNTNDPTADQKAGLAGTSGNPSGTNKYVTNDDSRNTDARTPIDHASDHVTGGGDIIADAVPAGNSGLMSGADKTKLDGIAAGAEVNVNADWDASSGDAQILNKPSIPSQYTDELAQDAIGAMVDSQSLVYTDLTPLLEVKLQMSITKDASGLKLSADSATPGNNKAYGTDASGVKGWRDFPAAGAHDLGGASHNADTLANLNLKISDADLAAAVGFSIISVQATAPTSPSVGDLWVDTS